MANSHLSDLERRIGRSLSPADRASIANLNDVPEALIAEARKLGHPFVARDLLAYYTTSINRSYLRRFVEDVVFGTESAKLWRRGAVLVPAVGLADQLRLSPPALLAPIGGNSDVRIVPDLTSWQAGTSWVGAPARPWPEKNYQNEDPPGTVSLGEPDLEPMPDLVVGVRRWIAGRIARCLRGGAPKSFEELLTTSPVELPPMEQWSQDARIAAAALVREFREFGQEDGNIPGFRAPDGWFEDS